MTPMEALRVLYAVAGMAPAPRQTHGQCDEAWHILEGLVIAAELRERPARTDGALLEGGVEPGA